MVLGKNVLTKTRLTWPYTFTLYEFQGEWKVGINACGYLLRSSVRKIFINQGPVNQEVGVLKIASAYL